MDKKFYIN